LKKYWNPKTEQMHREGGIDSCYISQMIFIHAKGAVTVNGGKVICTNCEAVLVEGT
jgi:hypothetical protein